MTNARLWLTIGFLLSINATQSPTRAENPISPSSPGVTFSGVAAPARPGLQPLTPPGLDELLHSRANSWAEGKVFGDSLPRTRGIQDVILFKQAAPAVVLIYTGSAFGTGFLLPGNVILTNQHVVGDKQEVSVVFKPETEGAKISGKDIVRAKVLKVSRQKDLACLFPLGFDPSFSLRSDPG